MTRPVEPGRPQPDRRPLLLLADDEPALTAALAPLLERSGFDVLVAGDGAQALDLVARSGPDVCVLDVVMPVLDGREVLRRLRAEQRWLPVLLLTQTGDAAERAMALEEVPTTTSTSRSSPRSWSPGSGRCSGAPRPASRR